MVLKLDLEKAYDRISWPFLAEVMRQVGFSHEISRLVIFSVSSAFLSM